MAYASILRLGRRMIGQDQGAVSSASAACDRPLSAETLRPLPHVKASCANKLARFSGWCPRRSAHFVVEGAIGSAAEWIASKLTP